MKLFIALVLALSLTGCSAKFVLVVNSGRLETGSIDPTFMREGTTETFSPAGELSIPVVP
ncbi:MAG TPA: hypothetical protein DCZ63_09085 [Geobacter sp.]|nr:hypothetical protein [Geobacter sp.]